jgi:energy-coupling factor transporter ATP-binding protein EcfA2
MSTCADLELTLHRHDAETYTVELRLTLPDSDADVHLGARPAPLDVDALRAYADPVEYGRALTASFFADPALRAAFAQARAAAQSADLPLRLRLLIGPGVAELHALHWETLRDPEEDALLSTGEQVYFSRYLSSADWRPVRLRPQGDLRALVVIANPDDLADDGLAAIDVAAELDRAREGLGDIPLTVLPDNGRRATLNALLDALREDTPDILYLVAHGALRKGEPWLWLEDADGQTAHVSGNDLTARLRELAQRPRLIVLASCESAGTGDGAALTALGPRLAESGIPAVLAMQKQISLETVKRLMPRFFQEVQRDGQIDRALAVARGAVRDRPDAWQPALFMRLKSGQLWEPLWAQTNPYRGLAAFTENDADLFFGREHLIRELSTKARRQRFIAVVGPSGSGKSSVVQAGLLPRLPQDWKVVKLRPGDIDLSGCANLWFAEKPDRSERCVLFIDQFEELFALCTPDVQTRFLEDMQALIAGSAPVTVILTLRADFYGHLQNSPLGRHLEHALVNVLPMSPDDLRSAIERPAQAVDLSFEAGLVETIVDDARQARHTLPLLQFALTQLCEQQTRGLLTYDAYVAAGRVAGAIGLWAEDTYNALTTEEQPLARRVFTRLVHYGEGDATDTRQRRALPELLTHPDERVALHRLLRQLADARLLTTDKTQGVEFVEIIHDALLKEWPRLAHWITDQREFFLWRQRLEAYLRTWEAQGRDESALLRGALLAEAERWAQAQPEELNPDERVYIAQSVALREREQAEREKQQRRLKIALAVTVLLFLFAAGAAWIATQQTDLAEQRLGEARNAEATAVAEAHIRATAQAETEAQQIEAEKARAIAEVRRTDAENAQSIAEAERDRTEHQIQVSLAHQLGLQAQIIWNELEQYPERLPRALLLAVESLRRYPLDVANQVTAESLKLLPNEIARAIHNFPVIVAAFSPDGQWVVSSGGDDTTRVWEASTGHEVMRIDKIVTTLAFSPDGRWIVSGNTKDGIAQVWDVMSGREIAYIMHKSLRVVEFSPDGQWVISGSQDGTVLVWEANTGDEIVHIVHGDEVTDVAFSPNGQWIVSAGCDEYIDRRCLRGSARVWEIATGREVSRFIHASFMRAVAFSPNGKWVVSGSSDNTRVCGKLKLDAR